MDEQKKSVYATVFDVMQESMQADRSGFAYDFPYTKETFLRDVGTDPQTVHVKNYLDLPNEAFLQAIFVAALKRLPDERTQQFWAGRYDLPKEEFQQQVLRSLEHSTVIAVNHIHLEDNPYFQQNRGIRYKLVGLTYGLTDKSSLRTFGKKLPMPIQKVIRRIFL